MRFSMKLISALGAIVLALTGVTVQADTPKAGGTLIMSIGWYPSTPQPGCSVRYRNWRTLEHKFLRPLYGLMISGMPTPTLLSHGTCLTIQEQ